MPGAGIDRDGTVGAVNRTGTSGLFRADATHGILRANGTQGRMTGPVMDAQPQFRAAAAPEKSTP